MNVLVYERTQTIINEGKVQSKEIICPKCWENCKISIDDYKIKLFDCKNRHEINNILLSEFKNTQIIDETNIKCDNCKNINKNKAYNKQFYKCITCKQSLCPLCKSSHNNNHKIIEYNKKNFICESHNDFYISYCDECKLNLCMSCLAKHDKNHNLINFPNILPNEDELKEEMEKIRIKKDEFISNIKNIENILKKVCENIETLFNINYELILNYEAQKRNYEILYNINSIKKNIKLEEINDIINMNDINQKFNKILNLYNKMENKSNINEESYKTSENNENYDEITIIYKISDDDFKSKKLKIFGDKFVKNNKDICNILYQGKSYELTEYFDLSNYIVNNNLLKIKLKGISNITDFSDMFYLIESLISLPDIHYIKTNKVNSFSCMFSCCKSLSSLPDISNWDTSNVINMSWMFKSCDSLKSLPDISKWDTSKVENMSNLFCGSHSLSTLPDISKWNTIKVKSFFRMFSCCTSLLSLPNISCWDTNNVTKMHQMFSYCSSLLSLPDISKWNTNNLTDISLMFWGCSSLKELPDISKWKTDNVTSMEGLFKKCSSLLSLPDISKWKTDNVTNMEELFKDCSSLLSLPDISKWNIKNDTKLDKMFEGCKSDLNIPKTFQK